MRKRNPRGPIEPPIVLTEPAVRRYVDRVADGSSYTSTALAADLVTLAGRFESSGDGRLAEVVREGMRILGSDFPPDLLQAIRLANFARKLGLDTGWEHLPALRQMDSDYVAAEPMPGVPGRPPPPWTSW